jgi:D-sedoheptulose 7-phosphate isomerase
MIDKIIDEIIKNFVNLKLQNISQINRASEIITKTLKKNGKILFCGNGGSAADSQHLAAELVVKYKKKRAPLPAIALTTDSSVLTAVANDFSFEDIFSRQVDALGNKNDVLYVSSTSGKSKNIIKAIKTAKKKQMKIIGLTGKKGGKMDLFCDVIIRVPSTNAARIQEMHIAIGQIICEVVEDTL